MNVSEDPHAQNLSVERADAWSEMLCTALAAAFESALIANPERWRLLGVKREFLMKLHLPVIRLAREGATLSFIVAPTNPAVPAYKRTRRFDLTYFSEDVPDDQQGGIYRRDRATIDRMVAWLVQFDIASGDMP